MISGFCFTRLQEYFAGRKIIGIFPIFGFFGICNAIAGICAGKKLQVKDIVVLFFGIDTVPAHAGMNLIVNKKLIH